MQVSVNYIFFGLVYAKIEWVFVYISYFLSYKFCSYDQLEHKQIWKEGFFTKERVKNTSFTYNCLDLDLKQYFTDRRKICILSVLSKDFAILKPDKENGMVILNLSDYTKLLRSILMTNPNSLALMKIQLTLDSNYLLTLRKRNEISGSGFKFMRPKTASFGQAHGMPKMHRPFGTLLTQQVHLVTKLANFSPLF